MVLGTAGGLLLVQGVVFLLRRLLANLGMLSTPLDLVTLAGIVGASAVIAMLLRRRVETTRPETAIGIACFAGVHLIATVVIAGDWVVSGQMNVLQVALAVVVSTVFAATGTGIGRRIARPG